MRALQILALGMLVTVFVSMSLGQIDLAVIAGIIMVSISWALIINDLNKSI